jgi:hypothetical protein
MTGAWIGATLDIAPFLLGTGLALGRIHDIGFARVAEHGLRPLSPLFIDSVVLYLQNGAVFEFH